MRRGDIIHDIRKVNSSKSSTLYIVEVTIILVNTIFT